MNRSMSQPHPVIIQDIYVSPVSARPKIYSANYLNTAIGALADRWEQYRHPAQANQVPVRLITPTNLSQPRYTRVGPLSTFTTLPKTSTSSSFLQNLLPVITLADLQEFGSRALLTLKGILSPMRKVHISGLHRPIKYIRNRGVQTQTDLEAVGLVWTRRVGLPVMLLLCLALLAILSWPLPTTIFQGNAHHPNQTLSSTNASSSATQPFISSVSSPGTAHVVSTAPTSQTTPTTQKSIPGSTTPAPGGSLLQLPLPYTLTIPGQNIQAGGKEILITSPTTVTIN